MGTSGNYQNQPGKNHDGQKNYQHSNQRNPDNVRDDLRKNQYEDYDEKLTNDENFVAGEQNTDDMDFRDKQHNLESDDTQ